MRPATVVVQFACVIVLLWRAPWVGPSLPAYAVQAGAVGLLVWAVITMGPLRVQVGPAPGSAAQLVTSGPYRWIRHPMYTALLAWMATLVVARPEVWTIAAWVVLLADLVLKASIEERLLCVRFPDYDAYRKKTWRLLPPIY